MFLFQLGSVSLFLIQLVNKFQGGRKGPCLGGIAEGTDVSVHVGQFGHAPPRRIVDVFRCVRIFKLIEVSFSNFILLFYGKNIDWLSSTTCKRHYFTPTGPAVKSIIDYFAYNNSFKTVDTFVFNCPIKNDQLNVIQILQLSLT